MDRKLTVFSLVSVSLIFLTIYGYTGQICTFFLPMWLLMLPLTYFLAYGLTELVLKLLGEPMLPAEGKAILITGCDTGFGHQLALILNKRGYQVFAGCLFPDGEGARSLKMESSSRIHVFKMDITQDDEVTQAVDTVRMNLGNNKLWGVVANAGIQVHGWLEWNDVRAIQRLFDVNVFGVVRTVKAFAPMIRESRGRISITSSVAGRISSPVLVAYSMSKAAAVSLADGLRRELHDFGVHVSSVEPNMYKTNLAPVTSKDLQVTWENLPDDVRQSYGEQKFREACDMVLNFASLCQTDLTAVMNCFEHSLGAVHPKLSYPCDRATNLATLNFFSWLPYEFTDVFVRNMNKVLALMVRMNGTK